MVNFIPVGFHRKESSHKLRGRLGPGIVLLLLGSTLLWRCSSKPELRPQKPPAPSEYELQVLAFSLPHVYLRIFKDDPVHGVVRIELLHEAGDRIGWNSRSRSFKHVIDLPRGAGPIRVNFDTGMTVRKVEINLIQFERIVCRLIFDGMAKEIGCRRTRTPYFVLRAEVEIEDASGYAFTLYHPDGVKKERDVICDLHRAVHTPDFVYRKPPHRKPPAARKPNKFHGIDSRDVMERQAFVILTFANREWRNRRYDSAIESYKKLMKKYSKTTVYRMNRTRIIGRGEQ